MSRQTKSKDREKEREISELLRRRSPMKQASETIGTNLGSSPDSYSSKPGDDGRSSPDGKSMKGKNKFDYRKFLSPNLNLDGAVNSGKSYLFFDCPLLSFEDKSTYERFAACQNTLTAQTLAEKRAEEDHKLVQRVTYDDSGAEVFNWKLERAP